MAGRPGFPQPANALNPFQDPQAFYQQQGRPFDNGSEVDSVYGRRGADQQLSSTTQLNARDPCE